MQRADGGAESPEVRHPNLRFAEFYLRSPGLEKCGLERTEQLRE